MSASCSIWSPWNDRRSGAAGQPRNRILTALGLRRLQSRARPGVAALLAAAGVTEDREVDARTVAWKLAPRINAPGRLGAALPALSLLLADPTTAAEHAQVLEAANTERRTLQDRVVSEALEQLGDRDPGPAVVISGEGWPAGVVGIVAAKLVDRYQRPAFVVGIDPGVELQLSTSSGNDPRAPTSNVRATTCFRSGSLAKLLGSPQGWAGSEQPSSMTVGARLPSL